MGAAHAVAITATATAPLPAPTGSVPAPHPLNSGPHPSARAARDMMIRMTSATPAPETAGPSRFDEVCRVWPVEHGVGFAAEVDAEWSIAGKPNGGYLLALCAQAASAQLREAGEHHPHVIAASATYLSATPFGAVQLQVEELRRGRSSSVLRSRLLTDDELRVEATITFGRLHSYAEPYHDGVAQPQLPPLDRCMRLPVDGPGFTVPLMGVLDEHLDPACLGWTTGAPSGEGELRGYLAFGDGRPFDPLSLLLAVDALPPATFDVGLTGWVPTMQLSAWARGLPAPGPLVVRQRARLIEAALVDETCDVWDSRGRLVATGHQLAAVRIPRH
jgi:Thioesterase-like superfamily